MNLTYTYDKSGNASTGSARRLRKINSTATVVETQNFTYDTLDRLITANATGGPANYSETYTYDSTTGNLDLKAGTDLNYNDAAHAHAVTHLGSTQKYWYDANGSQTKRIVGADTYDLKYDAENRLIEVKKNSVVIAAFTYDGDGKQVKSVINGVTTYLVGAHYHVENGQVTKYYFAGAQRVAVRKNGTLSYLLTDHLGSTLGITNTSGALTAGTLYKAWGETRYTLGTNPTKFKYTGQREVSAFGLYFYNARWYDPVSGRFSQADIIVPGAGNSQAWDRFAYTLNNPLKYADPSGHFAKEQLKKWFGDDWLKYINDNFSDEMVALLLTAEFGDMVAYEVRGEVYGAIFAQDQDGNLVMWNLATKSQTSLTAIDNNSILGLYRIKSDNGDYEVEKDFLQGNNLPNTLKLSPGSLTGTTQQANVNANIG